MNPVRIKAARAWVSSMGPESDSPTLLFRMSRAAKNAWLGADIRTLYDVYRRYAEATFTQKSIEERAKDKVRTAWAKQLVSENYDTLSFGDISRSYKTVPALLAHAAEVLPQVREYLDSVEVE